MLIYLFDELFSGLLNVLTAVAMNGEVSLESIVLLDHSLHGGQVLPKIIATKR